MEGFSIRKLRDLLAAAEAVGNNESITVRLADSRQQSSLPHFPGYFVMLFLKTKRTGHTATARIENFVMEAEPFENFLLLVKSHYRAVMTVSLHKGFAVEFGHGIIFDFFFKKFA
jgi:hypothetical protein